MGYGAMQGIPMVASSPVRHDSPLNLHGLEVTSYQPPWKALSDFALHADLDSNGPVNHSPAFQHLVNQASLFIFLSILPLHPAVFFHISFLGFLFFHFFFIQNLASSVYVYYLFHVSSASSVIFLWSFFIFFNNVRYEKK
jgi:hypothetical protein